jgi:plastocyanin
VRPRIWLLGAVLAGALAPATAHAAAPPLTADFTAVDLPAPTHAWRVTGTQDTVATIAAHGTVTWHFNQVAGVNANTPHDVFFQTGPRPTECTPTLSATGQVPTAGPTRAPWVASCRFDTPGTYTFVCQIHATMRASVVVSAADSSGSTGGDVPATLALGIGSATNLGNFLLGVAKDYTADLPATVTSTGADATLTAHDPSTNAPGYLLNGTYVMAQPLQVKASNAAIPATSFAPLTSPATLLTWSGPVSNDAVTVSFKQSIGLTDPLRSGAYTKTITFTLSTTSP